MKSFGLIGYPLEHSFSKSYFEKKFLNENIKDVKYLNIECQDLNELFKSVTNFFGTFLSIINKHFLKLLQMLLHRFF